MLFENAHTVQIDIESELGVIEVADLLREAPDLTRIGGDPTHVRV
jgi:hypothetical protein